MIKIKIEKQIIYKVGKVEKLIPNVHEQKVWQYDYHNLLNYAEISQFFQHEFNLRSNNGT